MKNYDEITNNLLSRRDEFVKTRKKRTKIITSVSLCAVVLVSALSVGLTRGGVFETKNSQSNINSDNNSQNDTSTNSSLLNNENSNVIYSDASNDTNIELEQSIRRLDEKYLSEELQEKMIIYKDKDVVYRLIVQIFIAEEDSIEADKKVIANKDVKLLYEQKEAAYLEEQKAWAEYRAFSEANPGNTPEIIEKNKEFVAIIEEKEKITDKLQREYQEMSFKVYKEICKNIITERLEYAKQFSENTAEYNNTNKYYMTLSAEEINILTEKGGYAFSLAPYPNSTSNNNSSSYEKEPIAIDS